MHHAVRRGPAGFDSIGIVFPRVFGVGYDTISLALESQFAWYMLLMLVFMKMIATSLTIGSGGSGGVFAPSLFLGACLGGLVGTLVHTLFPAITASSGAYALVGMGAVAAGAMHAPITSIIIMFELTNDYRIILPLMIACNVIEAYNRAIFKKDTVTSMSTHLALTTDLKRITLGNGEELSEIEVPGWFIGQTLQKLQLRQRYGLEVILIKKGYDEETKQWGSVLTSKADYRFKHGDTILLMGAKGSIDKLSEMG